MARHLRVARTARYHEIPASAPVARELWIAIHGYGQLAGHFIRHLAVLDDGQRHIVAPEALSRFYLEHPARRGAADTRVGATWMTREDREAEIADHVAYLDALCAAVLAAAPQRPTIHVLGFSQGVATATRWLAHGRTRVDHVVLWAGRVPVDLFPLDAASPLRQVAIDVVTGDTDELATPEVLEEQRELLAQNGLPVTMHRHPGGHRLHGETLLAIAAARRG